MNPVMSVRLVQALLNRVAFCRAVTLLHFPKFLWDIKLEVSQQHPLRQSRLQTQWSRHSFVFFWKHLNNNNIQALYFYSELPTWKQRCKLLGLVAENPVILGLPVFKFPQGELCASLTPLTGKGKYACNKCRCCVSDAECIAWKILETTGYQCSVTEMEVSCVRSSCWQRMDCPQRSFPQLCVEAVTGIYKDFSVSHLLVPALRVHISLLRFGSKKVNQCYYREFSGVDLPSNLVLWQKERKFCSTVLGTEVFQQPNDCRC